MVETPLPVADASEEPPQLRETSPIQLVVAIAGETVRTYTLSQARVTLGRGEDNQIVINSKIVSRHHATLERGKTGYQVSVLPEASNPVLLEGQPLAEPHQLRTAMSCASAAWTRA